ncbi:hypothetical protein GTW20_14160 [Nocardiopsis alba]|uniref:Uncharacterized protein n=1 Tax=Nocardiopsis alba TaxID=53437 RepID=A0A7K2IU70_9ACTN|nr:hypothetical protein [Nocardiopsis alba]
MTAPPPSGPASHRLSTGTLVALGGAGLATVFLVLVTIAALLRSGPDGASEPPTADASPTTPETTVEAGGVDDEPTERRGTPEAIDPPPFPEPETLSGSGTGDTLLDLGDPFEDTRILSFRHEGEGEFMVWAMESDRETMNRVEWAEGPYEGRRLLGPSFQHEEIAYLSVEAEGAWELVVEPLTAAVPWEPEDDVFSGSGDEVVQLWWAPNDMDDLRMTYEEEGPFSVRSRTLEDLGDSMVLSDGPLDESAPLREGTVVLEIGARRGGDWTLSR